MTSFYRNEQLNPTPEDIWGTPDELSADAEVIPIQQRLRVLLALCLRCQTINDVGLFQFINDHVSLPNGDQMTAEDWVWEATKAHHGSRGVSSVSKGFRRSWYCSHCALYTWHIAEGIK